MYEIAGLLLRLWQSQPSLNRLLPAERVSVGSQERPVPFAVIEPGQEELAFRTSDGYLYRLRMTIRIVDEDAARLAALVDEIKRVYDLWGRSLGRRKWLVRLSVEKITHLMPEPGLWEKHLACLAIVYVGIASS